MELHLRTLGELDLRGPAGTELRAAVLQPKRIALLTYLAVATPRGFHRRDSLLALLWPEHDAEHARAALRQALYALRHALGEQILVTRGEDVGIGASLTCDVGAFEQAVAQGEDERAVAHYGGAFLSGFYVAGAPELEHWAEGERTRLAGMYAAALERLAEGTSPGDALGGVRWWRLLAQHDPYCPRIALRLMEALAAAGDAPAAIRHAAQHAARLHDELDAEPDPDVQALAERLRTRPPGGRARGVASAASQASATTPGTERPLVDVPPPAAPLASIPPPRARRRTRVAAGALSLLTVSAVLWWLAAATRPAAPIAIAVLPFVNLSGDPAHEYLVTGLREAVSAHLGILEGLRVIATDPPDRSGASDSSDRSDPPDPAARRQVADELRTTRLVEGGVRVAGERIRVHVEVYDAPSEAILLTREYEGHRRGLFEIESRVARDVAAALRVPVPRADRARMTRPQTTNMHALEYYLRGTFKLSRWNDDDLDSAIIALEAAIAADSGYAAARAALADAYNEKADMYESSALLREKAFIAAEMALRLDPELADAHIARGNVLWTKQNDFPHDAALRAFRRAAVLAPSASRAHDRLSLVYLHVGLLDLALEEARIAVSLDPVDQWSRLRFAMVLTMQRRFEEAEVALRALPPHISAPLRGSLLGESLVYLGRPREALHMLDALLDSVPTDPWVHATRALAHASLGDRARAERDIATAAAHLHLLSHAHHAELAIGQAYAVLGDHDDAIQWLRDAARDGFPCYPRFAGDPLLKELEGDARFQALLRELRAEWEGRTRKYGPPS